MRRSFLFTAAAVAAATRICAAVSSAGEVGPDSVLAFRYCPPSKYGAEEVRQES